MTPCTATDHIGRECVYYAGHEERSGMPHRFEHLPWDEEEA